jgi:FKBP-type peptidyl-prolyl cis-trans isomerase FklB
MRVFVALAASLMVVATVSYAQKKTELKTQMQKASYGVGLNIGRNFREDFPDVDIDAIVQGFRDALSGVKPALDDKELGQVMMAFQQEMTTKRTQRMAAAAQKNKKEGDKFLTENKKKQGVVTLPSGLQYKVLKSGTGPMPKQNDTVRCHYRGTLVSGKEFDSSYKRGAPIEFPLGQVVIRGWTEALQLMPVGSKWELCIPSNLAYGEQGRGADIGPDATLIFEVELLGIK